MFRFKAALITIGVIGVLFIGWLFFHGSSQNQPATNQVSTLPATNESASQPVQPNYTDTGRTGGIAQNILNFFGSNSNPSISSQTQSSTTSNSKSQTTQQNQTQQNPNPPTNSGTTSQPPTQQQSAPILPLPTESGFNVQLLTVSSQNSTVAYKNYAAATASAVSSFDLVNNLQTIAQQYQSLDPRTLKQLQDQAQAKVSALQKIPVPSQILGMGERYYLVYQNYYQINALTLAIMSSSISTSDRQQKEIQLQNTFDQFSEQVNALSADIQTIANLN